MSNPPRTQPHDLDAEKAVLGSILIENKGYDLISSQLESKDFFRDGHRRIYKAMGDKLSVGQPVDIRLLCAELATRKHGEDSNDLEECGGPAYVAALVDGVPRAYNVKQYAQIVKEKSAYRQLMKIGKWLHEAANDQQHTAHEITNEADLKLTTLASQAKFASGAVPVGDSLPALERDLDQRIERKGQIAGFPTGFASADLYTHGWQRRQMVVIAAETSYGKSMFALGTALSIALQGQRVVYYSYEMPKQDLIYRLWSSLSGVPLTQILWGNIRTDHEWDLLRQAKAVIEGLPLEINDSASRSIADVRAECRQIKADRGLAAVVIDHFQLTEGDRDGDNRIQQLAENSRRIQSLGTELDICTFTLSQLTRSDKDHNREPQLDDLRECKSLGHEANAVFMLHPLKVAEARTDASVVPMKLLIRKQRGGRVGMVKLAMERDYVRFREATEDEWEAAKPAKEPTAPKARKMPLKW